MKTTMMLTAVLTLFWSVHVRAEVIEFPQEELATESVLPVFDNPESVKSRTVVTKNRFEVGAMGSYNLTEAFFNQMSVSGTFSYHFNEEHGFNIFGTYFLPGVTSYTTDLNNLPSTADPNLQYAPRSKWLVLGNYQYTGFYGKLSLTKEYVMNLSLFGTAGIGGMMIGDKVVPVASLGIGQKFYFSPQIALRFDLRALIYQGPNPVSYDDLKNATSEVPSANFEKRLFIGTLLSVGGIWLIPNS